MKYEFAAIIPIALLIAFVVVLIMITVRADKHAKIVSEEDCVYPQSV